VAGVYDYSTTPVDNGTVLAGGTLNIAEGCPAANLNNAERQIMADIASFLLDAIVEQLTSNGPISRDSAFYLDIGSGPYLNFDPGDFLQYARGSNAFQFYINNILQAQLTTAAFNVVAPLQQGGQQVWHAGNLTPGDYASLTGAAFTGDTSVAGNFTANYLKADANAYMTVSAGHALLVFDANDYLDYNRSTNKLTLFISGTAVASIDASGNLKMLGNITASTTP